MDEIITVEIKKLNPEEYKGKVFNVKYETKGYYDLIMKDFSFAFVYKEFAELREDGFTDTLCGEWLGEVILYGLFIGERMIGFIEMSLEWNKRLRISNIFIEEDFRFKGYGGMLLDKAKLYSKENSIRMIVLETQSCNVNAINCYLKNGFNIIGFDAYCYSNDDIDMKKFEWSLAIRLAKLFYYCFLLIIQQKRC